MVEVFWSFATQQEIGVNFKLMNCDFGIVIVLYRHRFADIRISMDSSSISAGHNAEADGKCLFCRA